MGAFPKDSVSLLHVDWNGIVNRRVYAKSDEVGTQLIAILMPYNILMIDGCAVHKCRRQRNIHPMENPIIFSGNGTPSGVVGRKMAESDAKNGGLEFIEPAVPAVYNAHRTFAPTILAQQAQSVSQIGIRCRDGAPIPQSAQVLCRVEAECRQSPPTADRAAGTGRAVSLSTILDHRHAGFVRHSTDFFQSRCLAVEVHREDRFGVRVDRGRQSRGIHRQIIWTDIDKDRPCAGSDDGRHGRHRGEGNRNDLIPRLEIQRSEREPKRIGAGSHGYNVRGIDERGELAFKGFDFGAEDVAARVQDARDRLVDLLAVDAHKGAGICLGNIHQ